MPITLTFGSTSVTLTRFTENGYRRDRLSETRGEAGHSYYGASYVNGPHFEAKFNWQIQAQLTDPNDFYLLQSIQMQSDLARRTPPYTGYAVTLIDEIEAIVEPTQTRLAEGTVDTLSDGTRKYFAHFNVWIAELALERSGKVWIATLALDELDVLLMPVVN